jgi:hypothetical protein
MGSPARYACCGKEMLGWIRKKMATLELTPRGERLSASGSITAGNDTLACSDPCAPSGDYWITLGIVLGSTHIHPTCLARLVQPVGGRFTMRGPINQEVRISPPLGFPHTMLNIKKVKDNMRLTFIKKIFTNREIGTSVQTRHLRFKGMSYENERYLCDINYVQLRKTLARFRCGNTQLEAMLGVWKDVPYIKRLCWGYDLGKV